MSSSSIVTFLGEHGGTYTTDLVFFFIFIFWDCASNVSWECQPEISQGDITITVCGSWGTQRASVYSLSEHLICEMFTEFWTVYHLFRMCSSACFGTWEREMNVAHYFLIHTVHCYHSKACRENQFIQMLLFFSKDSAQANQIVSQCVYQTERKCRALSVCAWKYRR